jgi:hypothetical protein
LNTPTSPYENSVFQPISPADSPQSNDLPAPVIPKAQQAVLSKADSTPVKCTSENRAYEQLSSGIEPAKVINKDPTKNHSSSIVVNCAKPSAKPTHTLCNPVSSSVGAAVQFTYQPTQLKRPSQQILDPKTLMYTSQGAVNIPGIPLYPVVISSQAGPAVGLNPLYQPMLTSSQPLLTNVVPAVISTANLLPGLQSFSTVQPVSASTQVPETLQRNIGYTEAVHAGKTPIARGMSHISYCRISP